jgi:hypothetical protein
MWDIGTQQHYILKSYIKNIAMKKKKKKLDLIKIKNFCASKDTIKSEKLAQ